MEKILGARFKSPPDGHGTGMTMEIRLYTREDCPLCDEAKKVLEGVRREVAFEYDEVWITSSPELARAYKNLIPVLEIDGERVFIGSIDPRRLRELLERETDE
jgi:glutaredoxin